MRFFRLLALLVCLLALVCKTAEAQTGSLLIASASQYVPTAATAVLEDPSRQLTLEQVLQPDTQQKFVALSSQHRSGNFGLTRSAIWLRLTLQVAADAPGAWLLEVAHPPLDRIELFTPQDGGGFSRLVSGDQIAFADRPRPHFNHLFPLSLRPGSVQTIYLRVVSDGTVSIPLRIWRPVALAQQDHHSYTVLGLYFGLLAGLVLYNLLLFVSLRERVLLNYVGFAASMGLTQLGATGLGAELLWPDYPEWSNLCVLFSPALSWMFALLFMRAFLATATHVPRLDRLLLGQAVLQGMVTLTTLALPYQTGVWLVNACGALFALTVAGVSIYSLQQRYAGAAYFLAAWSALLASILVRVLHNMGWLSASPLVSNAMLIGSAVEMLVLAFSLADRIRISRRETAAARRREREVVAALRESERELEARVLARTEELEKANQQLQRNENQLALQVNHDNLTGLANRKLLNDRLAIAMAHAQRNQQGFAVLMLDLDGFKLVNDQYGHHAGDTVLLSVALRLTSTVRGVDTVARIGGDEFVLLLDEVNNAASMVAIANKIHDVLSIPITLDTGELVQIGTSIGLAIYPVDGANAEQLLSAADQAMYASKAARRTHDSQSARLFSHSRQ